MAGRDPPPFPNTPEDRGGVVAVVSFTFVVVATLTNGIRVWIRNRSDAALGLDDALLVAANVSTAGEGGPNRVLITKRFADDSYRPNRSGWIKC